MTVRNRVTVPVVIKSGVLPYISPFQLNSRIGVHLSWTPTLGRWWTDLATGWQVSMPFRLYSEVLDGEQNTHRYQGGVPVAVDAVAELSDVRVAVSIDLPLPAVRIIDVSGALNVLQPAIRTDGRQTRSRLPATVGTVERIRMASIAVGIPAVAGMGWVANQYLPGTVREYELRCSPSGLYTYPSTEGEGDDGHYREELLVVDLAC
ncbi:hypothetical protein [Rhodococcus marinonascens]|uniref:hypothetical protein n=1 Tax=Rhodococcus marinonascens TaxID=38311 RepID=UPI0009342082|nr:hypothetical protein [Rhodococcus marinonascens]